MSDKISRLRLISNRSISKGTNVKDNPFEKTDFLKKIYDSDLNTSLRNINENRSEIDKINKYSFFRAEDSIKLSLVTETKYIRNLDVLKEAEQRSKKFVNEKEISDQQYYKKLNRYIKDNIGPIISPNLIPYYPRNVNTNTPSGIAAFNDNSIYFTLINKNNFKAYYLKTNFGINKCMGKDELQKILTGVDTQNKMSKEGKSPKVYLKQWYYDTRSKCYYYFILMDYFPYFVFPLQDSIIKNRILNDPVYRKNINNKISNFKPSKVPYLYSDFGMYDVVDKNGNIERQELLQIEF